MICLSTGALFVVIGLFFDIVGVGLLAWPIISLFGLRARAKVVVAEKQAAGKGEADRTYSDADFTMNSEGVLRATTLAIWGVSLAGIGFALQIIGTILSN